MIAGLTDGGAIPVLERVAQFTSARHQLLAHNIANLDTPYFKPADLDPAEFQMQLGEAVDRRRRSERPMSGPLRMKDSSNLRFHPNTLEARPGFRNENVMFHDRNNRDLERIMQDVAENTLAHTAAIELLRGEFELLRTAIRERV